MFSSIKSVCMLLDKRISYVKGAHESLLNNEELKEYYTEMFNLMNNSLDYIRKNSSDEKLILRYEKKVTKLFNLKRIKEIMEND